MPESISETYFSAGQFFDAIKILRQILTSAKTKIWLEDNFLHPDTVSIIEPYVNGKNIEVRFLTRKNGNNNFNSFCLDLKKMKAQYPNANIDARENNYCHDRYLIIDGNTVFHFGHSFHDLGGKASQVNKVEETTNKDKILKDFDDWWSAGDAV